jgi:predicted MPP superfamily phosphohydrolase
MNDSVTVLHLTDLHFPPSENADLERIGVSTEYRDYHTDLFSKLIGELIALRKKGWSPDLVLIGGDVALKGKGYDTAQGSLRRLLEELELPAQRVVVCPGNHDADRNALRAARAAIRKHTGLDYPTTAEQARGELSREDMGDRRKAFQDFEACMDALDVPRMAVNGFDSHLFGRRNFDELGIGVVALNTAWLCQDSKQDHGRLWLQVDRTREAFAGQKHGKDIVLIHHPPEWWHPEERHQPTATDGNQPPSTLDVIRKHARLLLSGHTHTLARRPIPLEGANDALHFVGGATGAHPYFSNAVRLIRLEAHQLTHTDLEWKSRTIGWERFPQRSWPNVGAAVRPEPTAPPSATVRINLLTFEASNHTQDAEADFRFDWRNRGFHRKEPQPVPASVGWERLFDDLAAIEHGSITTIRWRNGLAGKVELPAGGALSAAIALGVVFNDKTLEVLQEDVGLGRDVWWSSREAHSSMPGVQPQRGFLAPTGGADHVLAIGVERDIGADVARALNGIGVGESNLYTLHRQHAAAISNGQATWLCQELRKHFTHPRQGVLHLFYEGPIALASFVGRHVHRVGVVQCYEFTQHDVYVPSWRYDSTKRLIIP